MTIAVPKTNAAPVMEQLLKSEDVQAFPKVGSIVTGKILSVSKSEVHVDIDGIATGLVRGRELFDESGQFSELHVGDEVQATVLELENENGQMELSFRSAGHQRAWEELVELMEKKEVLEVPVIDANRGGLIVKVKRIEGFLPVSQLTPEHYPRVEGGDKQRILEMLQKLVGATLRIKVIDVSERDTKLIVSEKAAWEEQQQDIISRYRVGDVVDGRVTGIVNFGCFVEFGDKLEGLVHISELAWQRIEDPRLLVRVGDPMKIMIIGIDGTKISLSRKRLLENPWKQAVEKFSVGQVVEGKIIKLNPFGAFVELNPEIQGLAHISELSWKLIKHPGEVVKIDEVRKFKILSIDPDAHRLGLSLKALEEPPDEVKKRLADKTDELPSAAAEASKLGETSIPPSPTAPADTTANQPSTSPERG
ncbi:MAG: S1 RNA-binding domain-containing protein [Candidatus Kerfeldbacteria bacterium]|nr:S1 RNA-binding domain-containing protein [Candidatus Kerfeldbacteria bacterium]